jgi:cytochrome c-type biogenesis protein CcmH
MIAFWIVAGLFVVVAVLLVVPPLLRSSSGGRVSSSAANIAIHRDQLRELEADLRAGTLSAELYEQARREIEARLLEDLSRPDTAAVQRQKWRGVAIALALAIPLCAVGLYFIVGNPQALSPADTDTTSHGLNAQQIQAMIGRLAERLKANPEDGQGWVMLGRSYGALGRFDEAASAYANAVERLPGNADVLADYADVLGMTQGGRLQGKPETIIERALKVDPNNPKALALAGTVAFDKKDYAGAVRYWERMLPQVQPESEEARSIQASIDEARALGGQSSAPPVQSAAAATGKGVVSGVVKLAPVLADKVAPTDTVFIFARAAEGPRMPLAIVRKQASELPITFKLDDSMAMAPNMKLSDFQQLVVGARISKSSNAAPRAGDLQGMSGTVTNGAAGITVLIDTEIR